MQLTGKTVLVTGGSKRLGRATALHLAHRGAHLVVHYRSSEQEARQLVDELTAVSGRAWLLEADLSVSAEAASLLDRARSTTGSPIDVLVNNASIFPVDRMDSVTPHDWQQNLAVNAWAPFVLTRSFAGQGSAGVVINLLDTRVSAFDPNHFSYTLSKKLLHALTVDSALAYAPLVRVNAVAPGLVLPPPGETEAYLEDRAAANPLRAHGSAQDVARAVAFFVESPFITGQVIYVDGGSHLKGGVYD